MANRDYDVTVATEHYKILRVSAPNAFAARGIVERMTKAVNVSHLISEIRDGGVGHELIKAVTPVGPGIPERVDIHRCIGRNNDGTQCRRRAWASVAGDHGYLCFQHLWQDGVEET